LSEQTRVAVSQQQMRQQHQYAQMVRTLLDQKLGRSGIIISALRVSDECQ
jgi:hypothetical protein